MLPVQDTTRKSVLVSDLKHIFAPIWRFLTIFILFFRFQNPTSSNGKPIRWQKVPIHLRCLNQRQNLQVSVIFPPTVVFSQLLGFRVTYNMVYLTLGVSFSQQRWLELWSSEEITCITSRNTTDLKRDITTCQHIFHQLSQEPEPVISSPLVNADQSPRPWDSMLSELRSKELKVTLERLLSCSEHEPDITVVELSYIDTEAPLCKVGMRSN